MQSISNVFTSVVLTADEEKAGLTFNSLNLAVLRNQLSSIAEEKLNLTFTPNDVLSYTQQEAYLKGQMDILRYLLDSHTAATTPTTKE
jgi:hypothetical protein